jgi:hypothetical protein
VHCNIVTGNRTTSVIQRHGDVIQDVSRAVPI